MPSRQPRWPSIGFDSCSCWARARILPTSTFAALATSAISSSERGRNSCSGGSSSRIVTGRPAMMVNSSTKSWRCIGSSSASAARRSASVSATIIRRTATIRSLSKNMCSVRHRPMPSAPNLTAVRASVGVSALARTFIRRMSSAQAISLAKSPDSSGWMVGTSPRMISPVAPSMVMMSPAFSITSRTLIAPVCLSIRTSAAPETQGRPHAAGDHGGVAGHAAAGGQDARRGVHAVDVLRAGLLADQDHALADMGQVLGLVGGHHDLAGGRARACRQAAGDHVAGCLRVEHRMQELVQRRWLDAGDRGLLVDLVLLAEVDRDLQRRRRGALAVAGLQDIELALLDRELDVLHVRIMAFQPLADLDQLPVGVRHRLFHRRQVALALQARGLGQVLRRADARDDVLALGVDQVLPVEGVLAGRRVAGEGDPGRAVVAHIAKHHGLDVDGGAPSFQGCRAAGDRCSRAGFASCRRRRRSRPTSASCGSWGNGLSSSSRPPSCSPRSPPSSRRRTAPYPGWRGPPACVRPARPRTGKCSTPSTTSPYI